MRALNVLPVLLLVGMACGDDPVQGSVVDFVADGTVFFPTQATSTPTLRVLIWGFRGGPHNVTWEDGAPGSGNRTSGTYERDFTGVAPSTIRFRCTNHSTDFATGMTGQVVVQ